MKEATQPQMNADERGQELHGADGEPGMVVHGIRAFYAGGPGKRYFQPVLECSCGFSSGRCSSWEEAGWAMDAHLSAVSPGGVK